MSAVLEHSPSTAQELEQKAQAGGLWAAIILLGTLVAAHFDTLATIVAVWISSDTFLHGFIIAPISCYLIWMRRAELATLNPRPNFLGLLPLGALGVGWLLATLADVQVARQYAVVAMVPAALWTVLGNRVTAAIAFPLAFLLLAVPFGDAYIPYLINLTADATVGALQLAGIPVYREGNSFTIPSGSWSVVEACSGIRYLIASLTLGSLYAYLTYRSLRRRLVFVALSILVPIAANSVRAFMIVMIGHLSNMQLAVGVDHLIYGWIFFGVVMLLLFWIGAIWREDFDQQSTASSAPISFDVYYPEKRVVVAAFASMTMILVGPAWAKFASHGTAAPISNSLQLPSQAGTWQQSAPGLAWKPAYVGKPALSDATYRNAGRAVGIHIAYYPEQVPGSGLVTYGNSLVKEGDLHWHGTMDKLQTVSLDGVQFDVRQARLFGPSTKLLVWRWYVMDDTSITSPYLVKARVAWNRLRGQQTGGAEIILAAGFREHEEDASAVLQEFLAQMLPFIRKEIADARRN